MSLFPYLKNKSYVKVQWKLVKVTPLKVNNRFTSTAYVGPDFSTLYFSNLNPDNVNHLRPDLNPVNVNTLSNLKKSIFSEKNGEKENAQCSWNILTKRMSFVCGYLIRFSALLRLPLIPLSLFHAHFRTIDKNVGLHFTHIIYSTLLLHSSFVLLYNSIFSLVCVLCELIPG